MIKATKKWRVKSMVETIGYNKKKKKNKDIDEQHKDYRPNSEKN